MNYYTTIAVAALPDSLGTSNAISSLRRKFAFLGALANSQKASLLALLLVLLVLPAATMLTLKPTKTKPRAVIPLTPPITAPVNRVFITSTSYNGNLGGLEGADTKCQERANAVNLGGTWRAWLSDNSTPVSWRFIHSFLPYKLLDGTLIANNWADLTDGQLAQTITRTETYSYHGNYVWSGTKENGEILNPGAFKCNDWTSSTANGAAPVGHSGYTDYQWSWGSSYGCANNYPLYCFEQVAPKPNPIEWRTEQVLLKADDFYITANGQRYYAKSGPVFVSSDPGSSTYTTLETEWQENGREMRLYLYFNADGTYWWSPEIRTRNGFRPPEWIIYTGGLFFKNFLGNAYAAPDWNLYFDMNNPNLNNLHFSNLRIQAFLNRPTPTPTPKPTLTPTPTPTSAPKTMTLSLVSGSDDAWETADSNKTMVVDSIDIKLGWYMAKAGFRFANAQLLNLKNKFIKSATLSLTSSQNVENAVRLRIYAEGSDACQTFSSIQDDLGKRMVTKGSVLWDLSTTNWTINFKYSTPDLKKIVQEVVDRPGFSGKAVCLILQNFGSDNYTERLVAAKESTLRPSATLRIVYY